MSWDYFSAQPESSQVLSIWSACKHYTIRDSIFKMASSDNCDKILETILTNYRPGLTLRPKQREVLEHLYKEEGNVCVSLPTGYGKSVLFHLIGRLLRAKHGLEIQNGGVTVVIAPLNIIQTDQLQSLKQYGISACKLDVGGHVTCIEDDDNDEGFSKVSPQAYCNNLQSKYTLAYLVKRLI